MQMDTNFLVPIPAIWIGLSTKTLEQTLAHTRSLFTLRWEKSASELSVDDLNGLEFGYPIILEFEHGENALASFKAFDRTLHKVLDFASMPIVLCIGNQVPAEAVVDWMKAGVCTYVEQKADAVHFQRAFNEIACRSRSISEKNRRFEELLILWGSIDDREAVVLDMLLKGVPNKTIANRIGVSERTVEVRRRNLYEKLDSRSVADVVRIVYELNKLDQLFHRIDRNHDATSGSSSGSSLREPKFVRPLPILDRVAADKPSRLQKANSEELRG